MPPVLASSPSPPANQYSHLSITSLKYRLYQRNLNIEGQKERLIIRLLDSEQCNWNVPARLADFLRLKLNHADLVAKCSIHKLDMNGDRDALANRVALFDTYLAEMRREDCSTKHLTKIVPLGDKVAWGRHPNLIIGERITAYEDSDCPLGVLTLWCGWKASDAVEIKIEEGEPMRPTPEKDTCFEIRMDMILLNALRARLGAMRPHNGGPRSKKHKDGKEKSSLIVDAAFATRKWTGRDQEYRVIGIRLEGMDEMGFLWAEDCNENWLRGECETKRFGNVFLPFNPC